MMYTTPVSPLHSTSHQPQTHNVSRASYIGFVISVKSNLSIPPPSLFFAPSLPPSVDKGNSRPMSAHFMDGDIDMSTSPMTKSHKRLKKKSSSTDNEVRRSWSNLSASPAPDTASGFLSLLYHPSHALIPHVAFFFLSY